MEWNSQQKIKITTETVAAARKTIIPVGGLIIVSGPTQMGSI